MQLWGVQEQELADIVSNVSDRDYQGNLIFNNGPERVNGRSIRFTLRVSDSKRSGAHHSAPTPWSDGRRTVSACWHATRDVLEAIFQEFPEARVKSAMADYRGQEDFSRKFPDTYHVNVGSQVAPAKYGSLCECQ